MEDLGKTLRVEDIEGLVEISYGLWGKPCNEWHEKHFGHQTFSKGDIIYITCRHLLENDIDPDIAEVSLEEIYLMLMIPVRWPYCLCDVENDAMTRREYHKSYRAFKRSYDGSTPTPRKYRTQTGLTRDPYVLYFAACVKYDLIDYIEWTEIPFISEWHVLYRPNLWMWRGSLITGKRNKIYELIEPEANHPEDYVNLLRWYRLQAYKKRTS